MFELGKLMDKYDHVMVPQRTIICVLMALHCKNNVDDVLILEKTANEILAKHSTNIKEIYRSDDSDDSDDSIEDY